MRLRLERSACAGHALCNGIDEKLFPLDDDGYSALEPHDVLPDEEKHARAGVESCPERALSLEND